MDDNILPSMDQATTAALLKTVVQSTVELRQDLKETAKQQREDMRQITATTNNLNNKFSEFVVAHQHTNKEIEELKDDIHGDDGAFKRIRKLESSEAGNSVRWKIAAAAVTAILTVALAMMSWISVELSPLIDTVVEILEVMKR